MPKKIFGLAAAWLIVFALGASSSRAQILSSAEQRFPDANRAQLESFDDFLDAHPAIARDLKHNPSLVGNEEFRLNHPVFDEFLKNHPAVEENIRTRPQAFLAREHRFAQVGEHISRYELNTFDHLLALNPQVLAELKANPGLVGESGFLARHADLREFFEDHPHLYTGFKQHPRVFLDSPNAWTDHDYEEPVVYRPNQ